MLAGRTGLSPVMVGRAGELRQLVSILHLANASGVALVSGEAGIGKTRLVQELVTQAPAGTVVLAGQADPGVSRPLALVVDLLDGAPGDADAERAALADIVGDPDRSTDERVAAAVDLVRLLTSGRVGLVVFEDIHWADPESMQVFEQLALSAGGSLVVVATYRPDGLSRAIPRRRCYHGSSVASAWPASTSAA